MQPQPHTCSPPRLPALTIAEGRPYLEAPFPTAKIGVYARRNRRERTKADVVYFVPVHHAKARLTFVFGLGRWAVGEPSVLDARSLSCSLTVLGKTYPGVGQGRDRLLQAANGVKHCALNFGLGAYLADIEPLHFPIGDQEGQLPLGEDGQPTLTPSLERVAREHYRSQLEHLALHYGPPLEHPTVPWNAPIVARRRTGGLIALAANMLAAAERQPATPQAARSILTALLARAPRSQHTSRSGQPVAEAAADGEVVEVDFSAIGPEPMKWAA